ncbi:MAG: M3 family metallopeptidase [Tenuifilaceae bacterium]
MKIKQQIPLAMVFLFTTISCSNNNNPLLDEFNTPYQTPPFDKIKHEHFIPAIDSAIAIAHDEINSIINNPDIPSFENTIEAMDRGGKKLSDISNILFNLNSAETDSVLQKIVREVSPKLTEFSNDINLNPELFQKVKTVYDNRNSLGLTPEESTLLDKTYKGFIRNGSNLDKPSKEKYRVITKELSDLSLQFNENLLAETNAYQLVITKQDDLSGLPQSFIDAAAMIAKQKGKEGWIITLDAPMYIPFMKYSDKRNLREELFKAYNSRCFKGDQFDNQKIVKRIAELRLSKANLLGYSNFAKLVIEERMAETPEKVNDLLNQLLDASLPVAKQELVEVESIAKSLGFTGKLQKWDWMYYSEKLKNQKYSFNEEDLKPYLQLEKVKDGIFLLVNKLYGIQIIENANIPVYHADVKAYDVIDENGDFLAVLYLDFFPREGKRGGAWMTSFRSQYKLDGEDIRPLISIVTNFTKPTESSPSLLTFNEFSTFLHEFGHALHGIFANSTYSSLSGTSVYWDFVELPSQIMENWAVEKDFLDLFAVNYKTGEKIPNELVQKVIDSKNFLAGFGSIRQLSFGILDMAWHSLEKPYNGNVDSFEKAAIKEVDILPSVNGTNSGTAFAHIFAGGYAAGYYSYKWAEVLDADAFSLFKENGIFSRETANSFRENILSKGGSEHPMILYKRFRGQEPSIDALLTRSGMK